MSIMALICYKFIMQITLHKKYFAWMFFFLSFLNFLVHPKYIVRFDNIFRNSEI